MWWNFTSSQHNPRHFLQVSVTQFAKNHKYSGMETGTLRKGSLSFPLGLQDSNHTISTKSTVRSSEGHSFSSEKAFYIEEPQASVVTCDGLASHHVWFCYEKDAFWLKQFFSCTFVCPKVLATVFHEELLDANSLTNLKTRLHMGSLHGASS